MASTFSHFGIIGAGAWGTALGLSLIRAGRQATIWAREPDIIAAINKQHRNPVFLPKIPLDPGLHASGDFDDFKKCDALVLAVPAQHMRVVCADLKKKIKPKIPLIICAKGIEQKTLCLMSEVVTKTLPKHPIAVLSGPTFAAEVAKNMPTAVTLACKDKKLGPALAKAIGSRTLRPYVSSDVIGVQIGGAVKNVLAIASGVVEGHKLGDNGRAAIITRGLAELARLGVACGGRAETFMGLSGLGDLVLTCAGQQSRNMTLGFALGQGRKLKDILGARRSVAEGVYTAAAAVKLAKKHKVDVPIIAAVDAILNRDADVDDTIVALLARPIKQETR
ncbi:MAG: NAD(P)H-dependent glycerol-3-phosphate dehydrogenase [Alphaproteobacteria bacterium]|nr:NAD(P)H-dependent glycerol-3-phosphate dehydrogenase [Alphaproteobacteria bacterium]